VISEACSLNINCTNAHPGNGRVERLVELLEEKHEKDRREREEEREKLEFQLARKGSFTANSHTIVRGSLT
jgi:hypothetical protein